jgi:hypothetical protein
MANQRLRCIIHVGQHKTGSKALQYFLSNRQDWLSSKGVWYDTGSSDQTCSAYRHSHFHIYRLIRQLLTANRIPALNAPYPDQPIVDQLKRLFDDFQQSCRQRNIHTLVISAEDLFDMHTAHELDFDISLVGEAASWLKSFIEQFGWDPYICVYIRRIDYFLVAAYAQYIKGESKGTLGIEDFYAKFKNRLNYRQLLDVWSGEFECDNLIVRDYLDEPKRINIVKDFVESVLRLELDDDLISMPSSDFEVVNRSPGSWILGVLWLFNRHSFLDKIFDRNQFLRLSQFMPNGDSRKIIPQDLKKQLAEFIG